MWSRRLAVSSALYLAMNTSFAAVLVVDTAGGPGVYTSPQDAIDAAVDGDIVLLHMGTYAGPIFGSTTITAKSLTLAADPPGTAVSIQGGLVVQGIAAGLRVVVRGIDITGVAPFGINAGYPALRVSSSSGGVFIEDAQLLGGVGGQFFNQGLPGQPALEVTSSIVNLVRCSLTGGQGFTGQFSSVGDGGPGIRATGGSLAVLDSTVAGATPANTSSNAGDGVDLVGAKFFASGSTVAGGNIVVACSGCHGGNGLVADAASSVKWLDTEFVAGAGPTNGNPIVAPPGVVSSWPANARSFSVTSPVHQLQPVTVDLIGKPGDAAFLFWSPTTSQAHIGGTQGWLLLGQPLFGPFTFITIADPSGHENFSVNAPPLVPASLAGFTFVTQCYFVAGFEVVAGSGSAFILLQ